MSAERVRLPAFRPAATARGGGKVVLVGYEDQDNLGVRYLSSRLQEGGHRTRIVNVRSSRDLVDVVREERPDVVGLSLIFQYLVPAYRDMVRSLRDVGVAAHVTLGGHYASFEPEALLAQIPEADSVVLFEGEETLLDLTNAIVSGGDVRAVPGLVFREGGGFGTSAPRAGREDLDELPWPDRADIDYGAMRLPLASMLGSRGCPWKCSFCSIITFYEGNGTKGRRRRDPVRVVDEMEHLHRERGVQIILWQDDDFLAGGQRAREWALAIASECKRRGLHRGLRWKISCRSDEVRRDVMGPLAEAGLTHVYMGVESGDPESLANMNKLLTPEVHLKAREVLVEAGLSFDFGFMLLEPWSTVGTVRNNIAFLRQLAAGGVTAIQFGRMLPYAGTAVAERLKREGRFVERNGTVDYDFLDDRLTRFYDWFLEVLSGHNYTRRGAASLLQRLLFEATLDLPTKPRDPSRQRALRSLASVCNQLLLDVVGQALDYIIDHPDAGVDDPFLRFLGEHHNTQESLVRSDLDRLLGVRLAPTNADLGARVPL